MNRKPHLMLGGDVMMGRGVNRVLHEKGAGYPFEKIKSLTRQADCFFVNLECAVSSRTLEDYPLQKKFQFKADPQAVDVLRDAGVDLVGLANNHALDAGPEALRDTIDILEDSNIRYAGAGGNLQEASQLRLIECNGIETGVLAYCDHEESFAAGEGRAGIRYVNLSQAGEYFLMMEEVRQAAARVDLLVVSLHWMPNWVSRISRSYRRLAKDLIDAGARILWGHSPHHILGSEWIDEGIVLYSTGDLLTDYSVNSHFRNDRQLIYSIILDKGENGEHPRVVKLRAYPLELKFGRTFFAGLQAKKWIHRWLEKTCMEVGSRVTSRGQCFEIEAA